jgi:tripartite ATP-independent transporter DctM subunit
MSETVLGVSGVVVLFALILLLGMSPGLAMLLTGLVGILVLAPTGDLWHTVLDGLVGAEMWSVFSNYGFTVIPLFVFLGEIIFHAGYSDRLFRAARVWFGHTRGGLAITTVLASAGFCTVCGSNTATAATMSAVALRPMRHARYHPELSSGVIAVGSTLGAVIPPSIVLVVYGLYTQQEISRLFAAALVPGFMLAVALVLCVKYICWRNPTWAPITSRGSRKRRLAVLPAVAEVLVLFGIVMGALFSGYISPTEAAGVGACLGLAGAAIRKRLSWKKLRLATEGTLRITGMVFLILAGATVFGKFLVLAHLPQLLTESIVTLNMSPLMVILLMSLCYLVGGLLMDALAFLLVSLPLFLPLMLQMGFDLIWFGQVVCLITTLGAVTPPIGVSCFVVAGQAGGPPMDAVFRGAMRFLPAYALVYILLLLWPMLVK